MIEALISEIVESSEIAVEVSKELLECNESLLDDGPMNPVEISDELSVEDSIEIIDMMIDDEVDDSLVEMTIEKVRYSGIPLDGNGGEWDGIRGESVWHPNLEDIPCNPITNPDKLTWEQICAKYKFDGINFIEGNPDFSEVSKATVEIDDFSENRYGKGGNFDQATGKLAEQWGCSKSDVKNWMKDNKYTWHELNDCKTIQLVPTEVHGNIRHEGGIAEIKKAQNNT